MVMLVGGAPLYESGIIGVLAIAPVINNVTTIIDNITFTSDGRPLSEMNGVNMMAAVLFIRNVNTSFSGRRISCTAVLSTGAMVSCTSLTLL